MRLAGDDSGKAAFDRLIVESIPAMLRFATRLCGNATDAEDIVQDALLRAARSWRSFRGEARITTWLFRIVINAFREWYRAGDDVEAIHDEPAASDDPTRSLEAEEFGRVVARHVSNLSPRQREVLVLIAYEELSISDAANVAAETLTQTAGG
jgi:RNA polymerase sigma-70 factor (ECF subfamily)